MNFVSRFRLRAMRVPKLSITSADEYITSKIDPQRHAPPSLAAAAATGKGTAMDRTDRLPSARFHVLFVDPGAESFYHQRRWQQRQ